MPVKAIQIYIDNVTGISKMDPGYAGSKTIIAKSPSFGLIDYVVKERLFNFYLPLGCIPGTEQYLFEKQLVETISLPKPLSIMGYDDSVSFIGDLFEAETNCNSLHSMGQIASGGVDNLAYFSRESPIGEPLKQKPDPDVVFNRSKVYCGIVIGDGDNIEMIKGSKVKMFTERIEKCNSGDCFPLMWTISPALTTLAPAWIRWYYQTRYRQRFTSFSPPSGHTYAYPGMMPSPIQARFIHETEQDSILLNTSMITSWEWFGTWKKAIRDYLPRYSGGPVRGFCCSKCSFRLSNIPIQI